MAGKGPGVGELNSFFHPGSADAAETVRAKMNKAKGPITPTKAGAGACLFMRWQLDRFGAWWENSGIVLEAGIDALVIDRQRAELV